MLFPAVMKKTSTFLLLFSLPLLFSVYTLPVSAADDPESNMVWINGGVFTMGSAETESLITHNEGPQHQVTLSPFYISRFPVTQAEFQAVMGMNPSSFRGANLPVENVNWFAAIEYCNRLSIREGLTPAYVIQGDRVTWNRTANGYRLPTEAEWEYAARAGTQTPYYSGISVDEAGWHAGNSRQQTHQVGQKLPNAWGLYDMHGNVLEWCWDWLEDYSARARVDPEGPVSGTKRVYRGGAWRFPADYARSAFRFGNHPYLQISFVGFRVARNT